MTDTDGRCHVHSFELAEARCRNCANEFCNECLVYSFGAAKPPYCVACALAAAGVRANAARTPTLSRREIRRLERERRKAAKRQADEGPKVEATGWLPERSDREDDPFAWADDPDVGQRVPY